MLIKLIKWASNFHAFLVVICLYTFLLPYFLQEETHQVEVKMSNDDVLGDEIPHDQEEGYRQFFYRMLSLNIGVRIFKSCYKVFTHNII